MSAYAEVAGFHTRRWSWRTSLSIAIPLVASVVIGAMAPTLIANPKVLLLACAVIALPVLLILASRYPAVAVCVLLATQPLEAFQVQTPIGTLSPSILLLALLLLYHVDNFAKWNSTRDWIRLIPLLLLGWLLSHLFRLDHDKSSSVFRSMITDSSFLGFTLLGICVAKERHILPMVAFGSAIALFILGGLAVLASYHIIPEPQRFVEARTILGVTSIVQRNYGLNVPWDAVALLVPLCSPLFAVATLSNTLDFRSRVLACIAYLGLFVICAFVFQSRNMILQMLMDAMLATAIMTKYRVIIIIVSVLAIAYLLPGFIHLDKISTDLRAASYAQVVNSVVYHPSQLLFGLNENDFYHSVALRIGLAEAIQGTNDAVHDFFLSSLVSMGLLPFLLLVSAYGLTFVVTLQNLIRRPSFESKVVFVAICTAIFAVLVEPVRAGIVGSWLILGLALGLSREPYDRASVPDCDGESP